MKWCLSAVCFWILVGATAQVSESPQDLPNIELRVLTEQSLFNDSTSFDAPLERVKYKVLIDGGRAFKDVTDEAGQATVHLGLGHLYEVRLCHRKCVKRIEFDTRSFQAESVSGGFILDITLSVHPDLTKAQRMFLKEHLLGKATYVPEQDNIVFDFDYTRSMKAMLRDLR